MLRYGFILFAIASILAGAAAHAQLEVVVLGTGIPIPNPDRAGASTLVVAGEHTILVDTGRNTVTRLVGAGYQDVSMVLFTHFHSDHIAGFGEVMVNRGVAGSDAPQTVHGPIGTKEVVEALVAPFTRDTEYRIAHHGEHWPADAMRTDITEHKPGVIVDRDGLRITMFNVEHEPVVPAVGYRIDYGGKSVVISGDTKKSQKLIEMARGCDILVHEAMDEATLNQAKAMLARQNPRQAAMLADAMGHHASTIAVAEIARDAGVKKLVLTHLLPSIPPDEAREQHFIRGMSEVYPGSILVGRDGMRVRP